MISSNELAVKQIEMAIRILKDACAGLDIAPPALAFAKSSDLRWIMCNVPSSLGAQFAASEIGDAMLLNGVRLTIDAEQELVRLRREMTHTTARPRILRREDMPR